MPIVPSWDTTRVYGTWRMPTGEKPAGTYRASIPIRVTNTPDDTIIPSGVYATGTLNTTPGEPSLDLQLPCGNDADNFPTGFQIELTVSFTGTKVTETYYLPTQVGVPINLRTVILPQTLPNPAAVLIRGVRGGLALLDLDGDVIDADGNKVLGGGGGGGGVDLEQVRDAVANMLIGGTRIQLVVDDANDTLTLSTTATINSTDAQLRDRSTHTGLQPSTSISDWNEAVQDAVASMLVAGSGVSVSYNDALNQLTINNTAGAGSGLDGEAVRDLIGLALVGVGLINITVNDAADTITFSTTATQNSTDAALRDRSTHTGMQSQATITNLVSDLASKAPVAQVVANISAIPAGSPAGTLWVVTG